MAPLLHPDHISVTGGCRCNEGTTPPPPPLPPPSAGYTCTPKVILPFHRMIALPHVSPVPDIYHTHHLKKAAQLPCGWC